MVAGIEPFGFSVVDRTNGPTPSDLGHAFNKAKQHGYNPKFLLLTNPNNPLGVVYRAQTIQNAAEWCRKRNMHLIMDECYALSVHRQEQGTRNATAFRSVLHALDNNLGNHVHMVWSISKDFGASGLRLGVLYTQNELLIRCLANMNIFSGASAPIQMVVSELLTDDDFVDRYLMEHQLRLTRMYRICVNKLRDMVVPFVAAEAGMFVYIDLSVLLPKRTVEWERKLAQLIEDHAHVVLTSGDCQHDERPGMFRLCYAWNSPDVLEVAMERLSCLVSKVRRLDWSDLDSRTLRGVV